MMSILKLPLSCHFHVRMEMGITGSEGSVIIKLKKEKHGKFKHGNEYIQCGGEIGVQ